MKYSAFAASLVSLAALGACSSAGGASSGGTSSSSSSSSSSSACFPVGPICNGQPQCAFGAYCAACGWAGWPMPSPASAGLPNPASYANMTGYVIDNVTKLWWQQPIDVNNTLSQNCASGCSQADAMSYCKNLTLAGHCDWRLPTRIELVSIVDTTVKNHNPSINGTAFPNTPLAAFWTSSPYAQSAGSAWYVAFFDGTTANDYTTASNAYRVRCVR